MNQTRPMMARLRQAPGRGLYGGLSSGVCPQCRNSQQGCVRPHIGRRGAGSLDPEHRRSALPYSCGPCWPSVLARGAGTHRVHAASHLPTRSWRPTPGPPGHRPHRNGPLPKPKVPATHGRSASDHKEVRVVLVPMRSSCGGAQAWLLNWSRPGEPREVLMPRPQPDQPCQHSCCHQGHRG